jgi:restriction endonuclease S subunit
MTDLRLVSLEDVATIEFGTRVTRKKDAGSTYPVYGGGGETFRLDKYNRDSCLIVSRFAMSEECVRFVEGKFFLNDSGLSVKSNVPELRQSYLDAMILSSSRTIYDFGRGTAQKNLDIGAFRKLKFPLPSIGEQDRVVAKLDDLLAEVQRLRVNLVTAETELNFLVRSTVNNFFSSEWDVVKLGQEAAFDKRQGKHTGLPYVGLEQIQSQTGKFIGSYLPTEVKSTTFKFDSNHVLYGRLRAYLNKYLVPDFEGHCSTEIFPLLPSSSLDRNYLALWLSTKSNEIDATSHGARMPRARMEEVLKFDIPLPPLKEQLQLVSKIQSISYELDRQREILESKDIESGRLKASIFSAALEGGL